MGFEFFTPGRIIYGRGVFARAAELIAGLGHRAIVVRGGAHLDGSDALRSLEADLRSRDVTCTFHRVGGEPTGAVIEEALAAAREASCDVVVGLGGGSSLDAAKAVAGLLTQGGAVLDYLEVIGRGLPITKPAAPHVAIPTTAGTGTEVTKNAVVAFPDKHFKASMRSPHLIPPVALVDPALTHSLPPEVTASTGLDALTQLIEPYVSNRAQPLTDALALRGIRLVARSLRRAVTDGNDAAARDDMALGALMGGICLANAGLGAVHGFAAPLGARFPVPHGVACAALLPHVMGSNVKVLRETNPQGEELKRYADVAEAFLGRRDASERSLVDSAVEAVGEWVTELSIPGLSRYGVNDEHVGELVAGARRASSMRYNPVELSDADLEACLRRAL